MSDSLSPSSFLNSLRTKESLIRSSWDDPVGHAHQKYSQAFSWVEDPLNAIDNEVDAIKRKIKKSYDENAAENHIQSLERKLTGIEEMIDYV